DYKCLDQYHQFTIQDDGPGIPQKFQDRIFEMFQTLKPRDEVEGSGIGLSIVKKLIETANGKITVSSIDGRRGTEFCVMLPIIESDLSIHEQVTYEDRKAS
ncbi:MAG: sensor histidine kinase, partial [Pseudomonadota bacterium]